MLKKKSRIIIFALVFCCCLLLAGILEIVDYQENREEALGEVQQCAVRVESLMNRLLHETDIMNAMVLAQGGLPDQEIFESMAEAILRNDGVRAVQYLPDGIVTLCYPLEGNEKSIGNNVLTMSERSDDAERARDTHSLVLAGPYELTQGGYGLIARNPVYLNKEFWGFSVIVLDLPDALEAVGLPKLKTAGYRYRLESRMADGARTVVDGEEELPAGAISCEIEMPNHIWTLSLIPQGGWISWIRLLLGALCSLAVSFILTTAIRMLYEQRVYRSRLQYQKDLEEAYRRVENSNREKEQFLSRMSHDLRMPLNGIQGLAEIALSGSDNPPETVDCLKRIKNANSQLTLLVDQILQESGPKEDGETAAVGEKGEVPADFGKGLRVMAVEDDPLNLEIMSAILQMQGFEVELAENGLEALDLYQKQEAGWFDAILMDIRMPVMDGLTAARRIRASGRRDALTVPIIAVTANAHEEDGRASLEAGMNAHIAKPIDKEHLRNTIWKCIESGPH